MRQFIKNRTDFLEELNNNGILFDWRLFEEHINNEISKQNTIIDETNHLLEFPIDFNKSDELAFSLYKNNIFPTELTLDYFKKHQFENKVYELIYKYKKSRQKISLLNNIKSSRSDDDRVRGQWRLDSSTTKRLGCSKPNLMSLPKAVKECVIPAENRVIIQCDFSQIELRILAEITQDKQLLSSFKNGNDIHSNMASLIYEKPVSKITEDERNSCKAINYGIAYGISAQGIKDNLLKLGLPATLSQAAALRNRFLDVFSGIKAYQANICSANTLFSLGGSVITTENMSANQCLNWPIQTSCSEVLLKSLEHLMTNKDSSTMLINSIHDEIWLEVESSKSAKEADMLFFSMQQGFEQYIKSINFDGEIKIIERM